MSTNLKTSGFGHKGGHDNAQSMAESLLTGKPLGRAPVRDRTPKLKPRVKPVFGRKEASEAFSCTIDRAVWHRGWRFWAATLAALVLALQLLSGIFD